MTLRCGFDSMKERMALSSLHVVRVQKARLASRRTETARLPGANLAWRAERKVWIKKAGRYRHERTLRRVMDTNGGIRSFSMLPSRRAIVKLSSRPADDTGLAPTFIPLAAKLPGPT